LIGYPELPPLRETVEDILNTPEQFLVYQDAGQIAAVLSYAQADENLEIGRLLVSPSYFRRGIASQLLMYLEQLHPMYRKITVSTAEANQPAIRLYQKHGFHIAERTVLPDHLVLVQLTKAAAD
jgi:ribosomal protein S18 acetylase RimI-like enzyme